MRSKTCTLAGFVVSLLLSVGAQAAPAAAPSSIPWPAHPAAPDDPAKVAAAKAFIVLFHPRADPRNIALAVDRMMPRMVAVARQQDPKLDTKQFVKDARARYLDNAVKMLDLQAHVVSRHFTMAELKAYIAFFGSPLGRKLTAATPQIEMEVMMGKRTLALPPTPHRVTIIPPGPAPTARDKK
ncbi:MAG TPA: DUF2059 domain-containing protein [Rhizomicrobium sp.]|jgi:hypothetical protein